MPKRSDIRRVLVIGSGPIVIGQAAEFDYAGTQACKALHEEGLEVILINSNPATIMTDKHMADHIYVEPLNVETVQRIIRLERPDSLLPTLGGQTGLNLAMELAESGFLEREGVKLLGCNPESIKKAEDREAFRETMMSIGEPIVPSGVVETVEDAKALALQIGYPVIVRPAYTLGGTGGGIAETPEQLVEIAENGLRHSRVGQVLIERCIAGWKEIEFEAMRDASGCAITICSMENVDPVGIHTGDSIVVAPAQTLGEPELSMLHASALKIITALGIEGGCNVQFALDPDSMEYALIEVNPRLSRSSALASKATGFPIAKVATKLAVGYRLDEILNTVTGKTYACSEPAVDYVVLKFPKWPFDKFVHAQRKLGTQMKATGEVMAIATSFEGALMKSVRSAEIGCDRLWQKELETLDKDALFKVLAACDDRRIFAIAALLRRGVTVDTLFSLTKIDRFFLRKLKGLVELEGELAQGPLTDELYNRAKTFCFPDGVIERLPAARSRPRAAPPSRWWTPAPPSMTPPPPTSTPPGTSSARSRPSSTKRCWSSARAPSRIGAGHRVCLLLGALRLGRQALRLRHRDCQQQPRDGLDRLRHRRPALLRAPDARGRARHRAGRGHHAGHRTVRRPDRHQAGRLPCRHGRGDSRHQRRQHRRRRGPRAL